MKREIFVRIATTALRQNQGRPAEHQAEAIAQLMDTFAAVMGEETPTPAAAQQAVAYQPAAPPAFPAPPLAAVEPIATEPEPEPATEPSLIITDTRMPSPGERSQTLPPSQIAKPAGGGMKVEDLNRLVQERTPRQIRLDVPTEEGGVRRVVWERNVISRHAFESVTLSYAPLNASMSVRELSEVQAVINVYDLPVDLTAIVGKLSADAIKSIAPRGPIMSMTPPVGARPVGHPADTYRSPEMTATVSGVFDSSAGIGQPGGYTPLY